MTNDLRRNNQLAFVQSGDGPPVLLIHGIYGTGFIFNELRATLDPTWSVIASDMRGHGNSTSVAGPLDAELVARDLIDLLDDLDISTVHVLGYSHGGATAQALARLVPHRVCSLILLSTYAVQPLTRWERVAGWIAPSAVRIIGTPAIAAGVRFGRSSAGGPRLRSSDARQLSREMARNRSERMSAAFAAARTFDSRPWLGELRMPTLVIAGTTDRLVSPRQANVLADALPMARRVMVEGAGHLLPITHRQELAALVSGWLADRDQAKPLTAPVGVDAVEKTRAAELELVGLP